MNRFFLYLSGQVFSCNFSSSSQNHYSNGSLTTESFPSSAELRGSITWKTTTMFLSYSPLINCPPTSSFSLLHHTFCTPQKLIISFIEKSRLPPLTPNKWQIPPWNRHYELANLPPRREGNLKDDVSSILDKKATHFQSSESRHRVSIDLRNWMLMRSLRGNM